MNQHPLLKELLQICSVHNVDVACAYTTFEVYLELSEVKKLFDLEYLFNETLKLFYLQGKRKKTDKVPDVYVPKMVHDDISPQEINRMQELLCPNQEPFYFIIRDKDSSSTCYKITKSLVKPNLNKKESESKKFHFDKTIQKYRKILYTEALKQSDPS